MARTRASTRADHVRRVRIFISSPGDVADERARAADVVRKLGKDDRFRPHLHLDAFLWDDPEAPAAMLANLPPQECVNDRLRPSVCDVVVVIFWSRMGTPLETPLKEDGSQYLSGTEWELADALREAEATGRRVLIYRSTRKLSIDADDPDFDEKRRQRQLVGQFFAGFKNGFTEYDLPQDFESRLENDLRQIVPAFLPDVLAPTQAQREKNASDPLAAIESEDARRFRQYVVERYRYLDLRSMGVTDRVPLRLPLIDMYVPLKARVELPEGDTWARELRIAGRKATAEEIEGIGPRVSEPRPLLEMLAERDGVIVVGDPGAGKTTFLKYLALRLASGDAARLGLEPRLPVLLPLSAFANALAERTIPLGEFIAGYYRSLVGSEDVADTIAYALEAGRALLLLDGLDEVRETVGRRQVVDRVVDFLSFHRPAGNKFVLTSRIVGYREVRPTLDWVAECTLVDFDDEEIEAFVDRWTATLEKAASGDTSAARVQAAEQREHLLTAVRANSGVRGLAANPLLLTILALMLRQGVSLPERRVELYQKYVETLLKHWALARSLGHATPRELDVIETMKVLAPLALWMHETSAGAGLVRREPLRRELEAIFERRGEEGQQAARLADQFLTDVREHAGLLVERGPGAYGFVHLTFQEYLAAVAIAQRGQRAVDAVVAALAARVGDPAWREVGVLAVGYLGIVQQREEAAGDVVEALVRDAPGKPGEAAVLAGEAVADAAGAVAPSARRRVVDALLEALGEHRASASTRVAAGDALARLDDPRFDPNVWYLPVTDEAPLGFLQVPAGSFLMGSRQEDQEAFEDEKRQHRVELPDYYVARYPVDRRAVPRVRRRLGRDAGRS